VTLYRSLLTDAVGEALSGHRCVSAWLGIGNALFLGFGSGSIAPRTAEGSRTNPPYELQTSMAGWRVVGDVSVSSETEQGPAERVVESLVGRSVVGWRLHDNHALEVEFTDGRLLEVAPSTEPAPEDHDLDEWWFCLPGWRYVGVGCGGRIVAGDTRGPASDLA
jgi:hypothetical protein